MNVGGDQSPVGPASLTFLYNIVSDLRATVCQWGFPAQFHTIREHLGSFHRGWRSWFVCRETVDDDNLTGDQKDVLHP